MSKEQDIKSKIVKKAWEDADFKKDLLKDPKAAIEKSLEVKIPDGIEIKVVEESANTVYLVLPVNPSEAGAKGDIKPSSQVHAATW